MIELLKIKAVIAILHLKAKAFNKLSHYIDENADWYRRRTARISAQATNDAYRLELSLIPLPPEWEPIGENEVEVLGPYYEYDQDTGECLGLPEKNFVSN